MSDSVTEWKEVRKLPKELVKFIENQNACKLACEKVVKEAIKHYEQAEVAHAALWRQIKDKYNLDDVGFTYRIEDGVLQRRQKIGDQVEAFLATHEISKHVEKLVAKALESEK